LLQPHKYLGENAREECFAKKTFFWRKEEEKIFFQTISQRFSFPCFEIEPNKIVVVVVVVVVVQNLFLS
jgi:hypothetical protein